MGSCVNDAQRKWFEGAGAEALSQFGLGPGRRVLDFGCGPGRFSVPLSTIVGPKNGMVLALDRSQECLGHLQHRLERYGRPDAVRLVLVEEGRRPADYVSGPLDGILLFDVLQHVEGWDGFFAGLASLLHADGAFHIYPAAQPHPGLVEIQAVREALAKVGFGQVAEHTLHLAHADGMVKDTVYTIRRRD